MTNTAFPIVIDRDSAGFDCMEIAATATEQQVDPVSSICTFFATDTSPDIAAVPYVKTPVTDETKVIMDRIRKSENPKPVSEAMQKQATDTPPMQIIEGTFQDYAAANSGNPLVQDEMDFAAAIGYPTPSSHYMAFPFPSGDKPQGVFFLFLRDQTEMEAARVYRDKIAEKIVQRFSN